MYKTFGHCHAEVCQWRIQQLKQLNEWLFFLPDKISCCCLALLTNTPTPLCDPTSSLQIFDSSKCTFCNLFPTIFFFFFFKDLHYKGNTQCFLMYPYNIETVYHKTCAQNLHDQVLKDGTCTVKVIDSRHDAVLACILLV